MKAEVPRIRAKQDREGHQGIACCSHDCWMESVVCFAGARPVVVNLGLSSDKQSYVESVLEVSAVQSKMLFGASAGADPANHLFAAGVSNMCFRLHESDLTSAYHAD